jgi:hypothetical protein
LERRRGSERSAQALLDLLELEIIQTEAGLAAYPQQQERIGKL